jgi:hypothetical protein
MRPVVNRGTSVTMAQQTLRLKFEKPALSAPAMTRWRNWVAQNE